MPFVTGLDILDAYFANETVTVPAGVQIADIWVVGAGGSGTTGVIPAGGGSGGIAYKQFTVLPGDWDTTLTVVVGQGAVGADGGDSTLDGALNGASFAQLKGGGGKKAASGTGGAGGTASGGDTNTDGTPGQDYDSENDLPGLGGTIQDATLAGLVDNETFAAGGNGDFDDQFAGFGGFVVIWWRN